MTRDPFRAITDHEGMLDIQELLDGREWNSDTLANIAAVVVAAGFRVRELEDRNR